MSELLKLQKQLMNLQREVTEGLAATHEQLAEVREQRVAELRTLAGERLQRAQKRHCAAADVRRVKSLQA